MSAYATIRSLFRTPWKSWGRRPRQLEAPSVNFSSAVERIRATRRFTPDDIELLRSTFTRFDFAPGTPWDDLRDSFLELPEWFRFDLDPMSSEYAAQQLRLWRTVAGVDGDYDPWVHEKEAPLGDIDPIRFPSHFVRRDARAVESMSDHFLATGMIMKHSGVKPGQWALEYGAGFGQTALQLARLGVNVDTVDISTAFCENVKVQAAFYGVPLTPFNGCFGWNPRGEQKYDLIWFYESFHHCLDFKNVIRELKRHLASEGRVLLAGEPIARVQNEAVPYPWGVRIHSEVLAVVRQFHWLELGFSEDFIVGLFTNAGFVAERMHCPTSIFGDGYILRHRPDRIEMSKQWLPECEGQTWHEPEAEGRWTTSESWLTVDATDSYRMLEIEATNHHRRKQTVEVTLGQSSVVATFRPDEHRIIRLKPDAKAARLKFRSESRLQAKALTKRSSDRRSLGIFVNELRYL